MIRTNPQRHFATTIAPQWSPDGSRLLIAAEDKTLIVDRELDTVSEVGPENEAIRYGRWSADGESVTYSYYGRHDESHQEGHWGVFRQPSEGGEEVMLTSSGWQALPSPDGQKIAYKLVKKEVPTQLAVMDKNGEDETPLRPGRFDDAVWAPDGESLIFSERLRGRAELKELELDTKEVETLVSDSSKNVGPAVSPDGKSVIFESVSELRNRVDLKKLDLETGEISMFSEATRRQRDPAWSPDGTKVAFTAETAEGEHDIYLADADGSNLQQITSLPGYEHAPAWSPDGATLAFYHYHWDAPAGQQRYVHLLPMDGSSQGQKTRLLG